MKPIAQVAIREPGPFPVPFELEYNANEIEEGRQYALHAQLSVGGLQTQRTVQGQVVDFGARTKRYQLVLHRR